MGQPFLKSYRGKFPFKLGTTSYIFPDHILPNVARLAPFFDEIEIVLFESGGHDNYPDDDQMNGLMSLSLHRKVNFNIHLPIDIFLGDEKKEVRSRGISMVKKIIERTLCLNPSLYTLHLDLRDKNGQDHADIKTWRRRIIRSVEEILEYPIEPNRISIETLRYPFEYVEDLVNQFGFSICLDIGHILFYGQDLEYYMKKYLIKTSIVHLHGFQDGIDHLGIERFPDSALKTIFFNLNDYKGIVSIEVFSLEDLQRSLTVLEERWKRR